ncbi:MAG: mechanosensitive ion channel domain-containing protein [Gemmatimonadales bacterium]
MESINEWLRIHFGLTPGTQQRLLSSLIWILLIWAARRMILLAVSKTIKDSGVRYRWRSVTQYVAVAAGLVGIASIWSSVIRGVATFLGLVSAGLAIALRDVLANMAGWGFIVWRKPFELGDRIEIGTDAGDVVDIRLFQFTLLEVGNWADADQTTGRLIHIPNQRVLVLGVANYTHGFQYLWDELAVLVTFESDWRAAKVLLSAIASERAASVSDVARAQIARAREKFYITGLSYDPIVYTSVQDSGVLLTLRYVTHARRRRATAEEIWEDILTEFAKREDIDFAYPTTRFYHNAAEGKPQARANPQ